MQASVSSPEPTNRNRQILLTPFLFRTANYPAGISSTLLISHYPAATYLTIMTDTLAAKRKDSWVPAKNCGARQHFAKCMIDKKVCLTAFL